LTLLDPSDLVVYHTIDKPDARWVGDFHYQA
jgi:hypothetical protein